MPTHKVTDEIITAAIDGFESQKARIDAQIEELRAMLSGVPVQVAAAPEAPPRKRKISAAARRRMALGQKRRWAAIKGTSEPPSETTLEVPKPKRKISEEGMKRIIAATKKRWRLAKAAKAQPATAKKAVTKKTAVKKSAPAKAAKKRATQRTATVPVQAGAETASQ
jgi:hypothetical protein